MRSPMIVVALAAALMQGDRPRARGPRPPAELNPDRAVSGNKARLLERYQRRQARLRKGDPDHG